MRVAEPGSLNHWMPRVRCARARAVAGLAQRTVLARFLVSWAPRRSPGSPPGGLSWDLETRGDEVDRRRRKRREINDYQQVLMYLFRIGMIANLFFFFFLQSLRYEIKIKYLRYTVNVFVFFFLVWSEDWEMWSYHSSVKSYIMKLHWEGKEKRSKKTSKKEITSSAPGCQWEPSEHW